MTKTEGWGECERLIGSKRETEMEGERGGQRQLRQQIGEETRQKPSALHH